MHQSDQILFYNVCCDFLFCRGYETSMKPGNSDIAQGLNPLTDYELLESVLHCTSDIKCIQKVQGLWRVYVNTTQSKDKLLDGFDFRNTHNNVFETNPFSAGTNSPLEEVLGITIKGVPLFVDDGEIIKMLDSYKISLTSPIKYENIRHPTTHKMTSILKGNRFVHANHPHDQLFVQALNVSSTIKASHLKTKTQIYKLLGGKLTVPRQ